MRQILVYRYIDINNKSDYMKMIDTFKVRYDGGCPNFGNKLWYQGIISEISTKDNEITYYDTSMSLEMINSSFDLVLYPMANIFSEEFAPGLDGISDFIEKLKIPVFVISCGAQAKSFDDLNMLVEVIGKPSKRFIKAVYNTGGDFALRGYFTADFFKKLGFTDLNVVGCPSLFQLGKNLVISSTKVSRDSFKVALNAKMNLVSPLLKKYSSLFYDQDCLFNILYNDGYYESNPSRVRNNMTWLKSSGFGGYFPELLLNDRIRLLADIWDWEHSLQNEGLCFSYGTRIHGNIIAVLSGLPAVIVNIDSRVKEMSQFYNLPNIDLSQANQYANGNYDLYELYLQTDYSSFMKTFPKKYIDFNNFLKKCGIVNEMNDINQYWGISTGQYPKSAIYEAKQRAKEVENKLWLYKIFYSLYYEIIKNT